LAPKRFLAILIWMHCSLIRIETGTFTFSTWFFGRARPWVTTEFGYSSSRWWIDVVIILVFFLFDDSSSSPSSVSLGKVGLTYLGVYLSEILLSQGFIVASLRSKVGSSGGAEQQGHCECHLGFHLW